MMHGCKQSFVKVIVACLAGTNQFGVTILQEATP
jgi:hypothetical protein